MRIYAFISVYFLGVVIAFTQPEISFDEKVIKYNKVKAGQTLGFNFIYTNTGTEPLVISSINVSCNCTKFSFSEKPTLPNQKDTIHVTFNTNGKYGWQDRELIIHSNAKNSPEKIRFKGMVDNKQTK